MRAILLILPLLLAGCVTEPVRIAATRSGRPEVTIATSDVTSIKGLIVDDLLNYKYTIREDTPYRLVMARPTTGMESIGATLATGNSYSTNPDKVADFTFATVPGGIRVVASLYYQTQMAFGQTRTQPIEGARLFNEYQTLLEAIKRSLESQS